MTETIIKRVGIFDKDTHKYEFTLVFKKITLDKTYYVHCDERGNVVDLRKNQSYVNFSHTDKLKQMKGYYYNVSINSSKSFDDKCYTKVNPFNLTLALTTIESIVQKLLSSKIVFITGIPKAEFNCPKPIKNWINCITGVALDMLVYRFITEDLIGEDVPMPNRIIKKMKALKDEAHKKQSRSSLFEAFMLPGLRDIEGITYDTDYKAFYIESEDVQDLLYKHIIEVIIPKFKEVGVQINISDFNIGSIKYNCKIPLEKVKLDNIDDIE
jgi:sRNA-binding regulator protein Hfq